MNRKSSFKGKTRDILIKEKIKKYDRKRADGLSSITQLKRVKAGFKTIKKTITSRVRKKMPDGKIILTRITYEKKIKVLKYKYISRVTTSEYKKGQFVKKVHWQGLLRKYRFNLYLRKPGGTFQFSRVKRDGKLVKRPLVEGQTYTQRSAIDTLVQEFTQQGMPEQEAILEAKKRVAAYLVAAKEHQERPTLVEPDIDLFLYGGDPVD